MKNYTHLTESERYHIYLMISKRYSLRDIAKTMDRSPSTISRELARNTGKKGYRPKQAQSFASARHKYKNKCIKVSAEIKCYIVAQLQEWWSPAQIVGRLYLETGVRLSHETIYRFILRDQASGGELYKFLRHQCKKYRKRYGVNDYRGRIHERVGIEERPSVVDSRTRIGDWEVDTMIGKSHQGAFVTLLERCSRLFLVFPIGRKTTDETIAAIIWLLRHIAKYVLTLTFDNGREFSKHYLLAKALDCLTYFATPYHSWERGSNENHNGLLRQFFPKHMRLDKIDKNEVIRATNLMNNRPRKCLGWKTPFEVFAEMTGSDYFANHMSHPNQRT